MVKKKELRSFSHKDTFLITFVVFVLAGSFVLFQELSFPFGLLGISGYDVAEIQADCGGATACQCNDALTSSRTLTATDNLTGCFAARALSINASHVVLDCDGRTIGSNGTGGAGVAVTSGVTNVTIKNCNIDNFTGNSISFSASSGNNSVVENVNFSNFNGSLTKAIDVESYIVNMSILHNIFKANSTTADAIVLAGVKNITIRNNSFALLDIAVQLGSLSLETANVSLSGNNYISPNTGILISAGIYSNNTFRDENVTGIVRAYDVREVDRNFTNRFVNTSVSLRSTKMIRFGNANSTFVMAQNESYGYYLSTFFGNGIFIINRDILLWGPRNISFSDNYSVSPNPVNYTLLTNFTSGGVLIYVNTNLNSSKTFNSNGMVSTELLSLGSGFTNISFGIDVVNPTLTLNSPLLDASFNSGTTETLLNVSTNENASCRYDTSNVVYASMANAFNSSTNFTHVSVARTLSNGVSYTYYVRCQDLVTNTVASTLNFSVSTPAVSSSSSSSVEGKSSKARSSAPEKKEESEEVSSVPEVEEEILVEEEAPLDRSSEESESPVAQSESSEVEEESSEQSQYAPLFSPENVGSLVFWGIFLFILFMIVFLWSLFFSKKEQAPVSSVVQVKTMKEYYASFVLLKKMSQSSSLEQKKHVVSFLQSSQRFFAESWLQTETKVLYKSDGSAEIQDGSVIQQVVLPVYTSCSLASFSRDVVVLKYLQALFGTKDSFETIVQTLEFISGKARERILLVSPTLEARKKYPQRIVGLDYDKGYFRVSASGMKQQ